jgi:hypothetical protein
MTEIATIHVHMFDFLSVSENLWLFCSVRVQQEFLTIPSINKGDVRRCMMTIVTHMEVNQDLR